MANVFDYIKEYKNKTFEDEEFNIVDNVIFSCLSYVNFEGILSETSKNKVSMEDAGNIYFNKYSKKELNNNIMTVQTGIKIFKAIYKTKRYKDLLIYNYCYKVSFNKQFSALFIDLNNKLTFISFEGTDSLVSGWREDAEMSYKYPVASQKEAIRYINHHVCFTSKRKYIIGGHSKGGNLALVAAMNANYIIKYKIKKIYMNDAPGLKLQQINSRQYKSVKDRIERIIPDYSTAGLMFNHGVDYKVILSTKNIKLAHNVSYWEVDGNRFVPSKLSDFSKKIDKGLTEWIDTYNDLEREEFVNDLFDVLNRANIVSILDIKQNTIKKVRTIIKESKKIDPKTKKGIEKFLKFIISLLKEESSNYISSKIPRLKH